MSRRPGSWLVGASNVARLATPTDLSNRRVPQAPAYLFAFVSMSLMIPESVEAGGAVVVEVATKPTSSFTNFSC